MAETVKQAPARRPAKAPDTQGKRGKPKRGSRRRPAGGGRLGALIALAVIVVLGIISTIAFNDRHWHAFDQAGDDAFGRGNYKYAERMYNEALQVARELEDAKLERTTLRDLSRVYAAQGKSDEARATAQTAAGK